MCTEIEKQILIANSRNELELAELLADSECMQEKEIDIITYHTNLDELRPIQYCAL